MRLKTILFLISVLFVFEGYSQCSISNLQVTPSACDDDEMFMVSLDFSFEKVGNSGFVVQGNGTNYGNFSYGDLPITLGPLPGNCVTPWEFLVRDVDMPTCSDFTELGVVCCSSDCSIDIVDVEVGECQEMTNYSLSFDLNYANVSPSGFNVFANGELLSSHAYTDLPLTVENFPWGFFNTDELVICDQDNTTCCDTINIFSPCTCNIFNITADFEECTDSTFYLSVDFDYIMVADSFIVGGNASNFGNFSYNDLPVTVGPYVLGDSTDYEVYIQDLGNFLCFNSYDLGIVDTCYVDSCMISNVFAEVSECDTSGFYVDIGFTVDSPGGSGFSISGNEVDYGDFEYGEDVYRIGPLDGDCETIYEFIITDNEESDCSGFVALGEPVCCFDCELSELVVEPLCDGGLITGVIVDFEHEETPSDSFNLFINILMSATFAYDDLPVQMDISNPDGDTIMMLSVFVQDATDISCSVLENVEISCVLEACVISDVFAEPTECDMTEFYVDIEFDVVNPPSDSFSISGNGTNYGTFAYGDDFYAVGPLDGDCETIYEFVITDMENTDCSDFYVLPEAICCTDTCFIETLVTEFLGCQDDSTFAVTLSFDYGDFNSSQFLLLVNEDEYGSFDYTSLPVTVDGLLGDNETTYTFEVIDSETDRCSGSISIDPVLCEPSSTYDPYLESLHIYQDASSIFVETAVLSENITIELFDILGNKIYSDSGKEKITIPKSNCAEGIYLLAVKTVDGISARKIFVR